MRRMLKRKIHPEFDGKGNKTDNQNKPGIMDVQIRKGNEAESVFLLQTPSGTWSLPLPGKKKPFDLMFL